MTFSTGLKVTTKRPDGIKRPPAYTLQEIADRLGITHGVLASAMTRRKEIEPFPEPRLVSTRGRWYCLQEVKGWIARTGGDIQESPRAEYGRQWRASRALAVTHH